MHQDVTIPQLCNGSTSILICGRSREFELGNYFCIAQGEGIWHCNRQKNSHYALFWCHLVKVGYYPTCSNTIVHQEVETTINNVVSYASFSTLTQLSKMTASYRQISLLKKRLLLIGKSR